MFCPHCGTQLPDGNKFCTGCGASLAAAAEIVQEPVSAPQPAPAPAPQPEPVYTQPVQEFVPNYAQQTYAAAATTPAPKKKGKTGLIIGLISAVVVIAALVCAFFFWFQPNYLSDEAKYNKAMDEAAEALDAEDYKAAAAAYKTALGYADGDEQKMAVYLARAEAYVGSEEYEDAISDYEAALEIDEDQKKVWALMADAYVALEDVEKAIEVLNDGFEATEADSLLEKIEELTAPADGKQTESVDPQPNTPAQPDEPAVEEVEPEAPANTIGDYEFDLDETDIDLSYCNLNDADIRNLANFTELEYLDLSGNNITDLSPLAGLNNLWDLTIDFNPVVSLEPLSGLHSLGNLSAESCEIESLDGLENCHDMYRLYLYGNEITDISAIAGLTNLESLTLWENPISDISPLANLTSLTYLDLDNTNVSDVTPLFGLVNLESLYLSGDYVDDEDWDLLYEVLPMYGGSGETPSASGDGYFDYSDLYIGVNTWSDFCHEDESGMLEGYAVDLGLEIAEVLGLEAEFYGIDDEDELMMMLESGEIDIYIDTISAEEAYEFAAETGMNIVLSDPFITMDGEEYCVITSGYYSNLIGMLNEAIAAMDAEGTLDDMFDYWSEYDYSNW